MDTPTAAKLRPWRLLLEEDRAEAVLASIHEIEGALASDLKSRELRSTRDIYLSEGTAGIALFFAYLQAAGLAQRQERAFECLAPAVDALRRPTDDCFPLCRIHRNCFGCAAR